jgi:hypothetical protein
MHKAQVISNLKLLKYNIEQPVEMAANKTLFFPYRKDEGNLQDISENKQWK